MKTPGLVRTELTLDRREIGGYGMSWRENNIGRLLFNASRRFEDAMLAHINRHGYPDIRMAHIAVPRSLDLAGTQAVELARRAGMTKQSMGELVRQCAAMGLVTTRPDPADGRAKIVHFTEEGMRFLKTIRAAIAAAERDMAARLGPEAADGLRDALAAYNSRPVRIVVAPPNDGKARGPKLREGRPGSASSARGSGRPRARRS
jgi:DNA-binding MarR family transcriptional regulator